MPAAKHHVIHLTRTPVSNEQITDPHLLDSGVGCALDELAVLEQPLHLVLQKRLPPSPIHVVQELCPVVDNLFQFIARSIDILVVPKRIAWVVKAKLSRFLRSKSLLTMHLVLDVSALAV